MSNLLRICAIDPSIRSTGIAILEVDTKVNSFKLIDRTSFINKKNFKNKWEKKEATRELLEFYLKDKIESIDFFVFEDYSYASIGYLADAGELVGLFKHYIWGFNKPFDVIPPSTIKRIVAGSGKAQKEDVAASLNKFISNIKDYTFNNLDETDAVAIGIAYILYTAEINERLKNPPAAKPGRKSGKNKEPDRKDRRITKARAT